MKYPIVAKNFKYGTFGLREEWLYDFLNRGDSFFLSNSLGPRQIQAFIYYLRDSELIDKSKRLTPLFYILRAIYFKDGAKSQVLWGVIWINLCFNSTLYAWWTTLEIKNYRRERLIEDLIVSYGKDNRYVKNGFSSIRETLIKSPIGEIFGQGIIDRSSRITKEILKAGCRSLPPILILYNLYKLAEREGTYKVNLQEIEEIYLSPQKIFSISSQDLEKSLFKSSEFEPFYRLLTEYDKSYIYLYKDLRSAGILEKYIGRRRE
ncbi:MAG: hypothetical protein ACPL1I_09205 [bacterium]